MIQTELHRLIAKYPRLKVILKRLSNSIRRHGDVSSHYVEVTGDEVSQNSGVLHDSWKHDDIPVKQRVLVDRQLADFRRGRPVEVFQVLVDCIRELPTAGESASVLEVGCSSGYYSEVFKIAELPIRYTGCDYSPVFIELARARHPDVEFAVEDATRLSYGDGAFDVVVSGCCLLHIPSYADAVAETARVARHFAIFHRTPVVLGQSNKYYRKQAYGIETVEIHFNEPEFLALLKESGLDLIETRSLNDSVVDGRGSAVRTYVCRKNNQ